MVKMGLLARFPPWSKIRWNDYRSFVSEIANELEWSKRRKQKIIKDITEALATKYGLQASEDQSSEPIDLNKIINDSR